MRAPHLPGRRWCLSGGKTDEGEHPNRGEGLHGALQSETHVVGMRF